MTTSTLYDPIMNALLALLRSGCGDDFLYYSRGIVPWEQLAQITNAGASPIRQPAIFLYDGVGFGGGTIRFEPRGRGTPGVRILARTVVIYARTIDPAGNPGGTPAGVDGAITGGEVLHPLIESAQNVLLSADSEGALTLGGLVSHCWIEGDGMMLTPDIDPNGQGMATLPVKIMVP